MMIPVAIETMSRYSHLKKCVESLSNNSLAKMTDLYISVDYPPEGDQKAMQGYKQIKNWLLNNKIEGFNRVIIYWQKSNLGAYENSNFLNDVVKKDGYDAVIKSEDDNVFSENFLEYMNQAIEYSKNDNTITSVCGYLHDEKNIIPSLYDDHNAFGEVAYSEWGVGYILERNQKIEDDICFEFFLDILTDKSKRNKVIKSSWNNYELLVMGYLGVYKHMLYKNGSLAAMDQTKRIWNVVNGAKQMRPTVNKVYNIGLDGSGLHVPILKDFKMNPLDMDEHFSLKYSDEYFFECKNRNPKLHRVSIARYIQLRSINIMICIFGEKTRSFFQYVFR